MADEEEKEGGTTVVEEEVKPPDEQAVAEDEKKAEEEKKAELEAEAETQKAEAETPKAEGEKPKAEGEKPKAEGEKPPEQTGSSPPGSPPTKKKKSKSSVYKEAIPQQSEDEQKKDRARHLDVTSKLLVISGPIKINDEDYLVVRLLYQLTREKELASGTFAKFYKARDKDAKEQIMKVTPLGTDIPLKYKEHLNSVTVKIERYLIANLHPNICPVYEIYQTNVKNYVFMEYIYGVNLDTWCKKKVKEKGIKKIFHDVVEGMTFLYSHGIAHGAINTTHVMLNKEKTAAKLVGFGQSVLLFDTNTEQYVKAKKKTKEEWQKHMPPEVVTEDYCPVLADVWGFGTMIVAVLTKRYPYELKTKHHDKYWKIFCRRYDVSASKELADLLNKIFVEPKKRLSLYALPQHGWFKV